MTPNEPAEASDVRRELGDLDDLVVQRILSLVPTVADIVEVRIRLSQEDDLDRQQRHPSPVVAEALLVVREALRREPEDREPEPEPLA